MTKFSVDDLDIHGAPVFILSHEAVVLEANSFAHSEPQQGATFSTDRSGKLRLSVNEETKRLHDRVAQSGARRGDDRPAGASRWIARHVSVARQLSAMREPGWH
jgi:hypothetical protein